MGHAPVDMLPFRTFQSKRQRLQRRQECGKSVNKNKHLNVEVSMYNGPMILRAYFLGEGGIHTCNSL